MIKFREIVAVCCDIQTKNVIAIDKNGVKHCAKNSWGQLQLLIGEKWNQAS